MHPDIESCEVPQEKVEERSDFLETKYAVGSIVWARAGKGKQFVEWPALIDDDPDTLSFFWTEPGSNVVTW